MGKTILGRIRELLDGMGIHYRVMDHEPIFTSEQAAAVRGTPLETGAKALVCKAGDDFQMFVMPANLKLSTKNVRRVVGSQRLRFATKEELMTLTGLSPGCVPPFGALFGMPTWCDVRLSEQTRIHFSAGDHTISIGMNFMDYRRAAAPTLCEISK